MPKLLQQRLVDTDTAEIHSEKIKLLPFDLFNEDKGYMLFLNKRNVRIFPDIDFPSNCGMSDIARLFLLSRQIVSTTNMIGKRSHGAIKPLTVEDMTTVANMPYRRFVTWLNRMMRHGMVARVRIKTEDTEITQYYLNPLYFFSDKYLPLSLYLLFQEQIDRHLPTWVKQKYKEMQILDGEAHGDR